MKVLVGRMQQEAEVELAKYKQSQELEQLESRRYQLQMAQANQVKESTLGRAKIDQVTAQEGFMVRSDGRRVTEGGQALAPQLTLALQATL